MNLPFGFALVLAAISGFIALAYEMIWTRLYNFATGSRAEAFGALLGSYLLGIAAGSLLSRCWQNKLDHEGPTRPRTLSRLILGANIASFLVFPLVSRMLVHVEWTRTLPLVIAGSGLLGLLFPLVCHVWIPADGRAGSHLSFIYVANIVGSAIGSFATGFILMDCLKLWQIEALLLILATTAAIALACFSATVKITDYVFWLLTVALAGSSHILHQNVYERLLYKRDYEGHLPFTQVVESRSGVIAIESGRIVYGGGAYDGVIDVRPRFGGGLFRPYFLPAIQPHPREILVIGVSAGAWTQILVNLPGAEHVTGVEINKGYLEIVRSHPEVASILSNPKVQMVIDDGRRWLRRNPGRHFDLIVMNTSFHWREFSSALLSREFLELIKNHLTDGGIALWNCTGSERAARTGMDVFPYTMMVGSACAGSMRPLTIDKERWRSVLAKYRIDDRPVFDLETPRGTSDLEETLAFVDISGGHQSRIMFRKEMEESFGRAAIIEDDDLALEYERALDGHPTLAKILRVFGYR